MRLFSEWLVETSELPGLPTAEEQMMNIVNQLKQQTGGYDFKIVLPSHWVEGDSLVSRDEDHYKIKDAFSDWDMLEQAGIDGEIEGFKTEARGEHIIISFNIPSSEEEQDPDQDGFSSDRDYWNYRLGGRNW